MSRKRTTLQLAPLPRHIFRREENKTEWLTHSLRAVAISSRTAEARFFYPLRDIVRRFRVPLSLAAEVYGALEKEGLLRAVRGRGTLLEGFNTNRTISARGKIAIPSSLTYFLTQQDYRMFVKTIDRELQKNDFMAATEFFEAGDTAEDLASRLAAGRPDWVLWYSPRKLSRQVALRLHDLGIKVIGVSDSGFPGFQCQYRICREAALAGFVAEWKKEEITSVKVASGPARSPVDEERIGQTLERLGVAATFASVGAQTARRFIEGLGKGLRCGIVILNSVASLMAAEEPGLLERLTRCSRVALVEGPVAVQAEKSTDAAVDLVMVDWEVVAKRIVADLSAPGCEALAQPRVFEAVPKFRVPLSLYSQRL